MSLRFLLRPNNTVSDALCPLCNLIRHINREILHVAVTPFPTAEWAPRFLIHDRDSRYGAAFDRRLRHLGIEQVRTPFKAPRANAISERWVKSVRTECLVCKARIGVEAKLYSALRKKRKAYMSSALSSSLTMDIGNCPSLFQTPSMAFVAESAKT
jgi:transposase InsO family protein